MPEREIDTGEFEALAADILKADGTLRFRARGDSMRPFIRNDDMIELEQAQPGRLRFGDVVLCRLGNGRLVVHRITRLKDGAARVQGDARAMPDGWVPLAQVLGRVTAVERGGRHFRLDSPWEAAAGGLWLALAPLRRVWMRVFHRV